MATQRQKQRSIYAKEMVKLKAKDKIYMKKRKALVDIIKRKIKAVK